MRTEGPAQAIAAVDGRAASRARSELQETNEQLGTKAPACSRSKNAEVERKNREVEQGARRALRRKKRAELAAHVEVQIRIPRENMSHELRTPLETRSSF